MVTVDLFGRKGNNIFQYVIARILAEQLHQPFGTQWNHSEFIEHVPWTWHVKENQSNININIKEVEVGDALDCDYIDANVHLHGYFQDALYYNQHRNRIKKMWKLPKIQKNTEDLVIHLRLTDYWWHRNNCVINPKWYLNIIRKEHPRKLYIVVEPHVTNAKYLQAFADLKPEIVSGTPKSDFEFLMQFDRIVCSNSTFAWWAAFLSDASKIYLFENWMGEKRINKALTNMTGATVVGGDYIRDRKLAAIDWTDYWKQPPSFFR